MFQFAQSLIQEIPKEMLDLSESLYNSLGALEENKEHAEKIKEIESRIGILSMAYRTATDIGNSQEVRRTAKELEKARKEKWSLKFVREQSIKEIRNPLEQISKPMIEQICFLIDQEIGHLPKQRILMVTDTRMTTDPLIQGVIRICQTNRARIGEVREFLLDAKEKVRLMNRNSISQILSFIEGLEEKINKVDLKKCDEAQMRDNEFHDEESLRDGEKPQTFSREYHAMAQRGWLADRWDEATHSLELAKDFISSQFVGRPVKYNELPIGVKNTVDVMAFGKKVVRVKN